MRSRYIFLPALTTFLILSIASCNANNSNTPTVADSTQAGSVADSMPVLETPITDTSAILTTPPVNDDNVVIPDSSK